ncbi:MAG TPA: L-threonine 3-dehydrogenase, partial [Actinomycetota bacterium]|nr:L-threonine 3-dehydrogenase [Actinomycetota bacterium]
MRALVKQEPAPGLVMTDVPEPEIGINDVLIRVDRTGICGTDLHIFDWNQWAQETVPVPLVIGHEFVGEIVEVGSNVSDFHPGDVVSGEGHVVCGRCRNCMAGRRHLCAFAKGIGVDRPGAFAEFISLPMTNVWHHDPSIDRDVAAIFDPFGNAVHSTLEFPVLGEDVLITGAGPIGLMACAVARHAGARYVVATDVNPYRLELAKTLGATVALDIRERSIGDVQHELGMKEGFDVGLEMSGNPDAFHEMLANMCHGGKIAML